MRSQLIPGPWSDASEKAVSEVLESMFFETPSAPPVILDATSSPALLWVELPFLGTACGRMCLGIDETLAIRLAANFLGDEDADVVGPEQQALVSCELANMLCGSLLSRQYKAANLSLDSPHVRPLCPSGSCLGFPLEGGSLFLTMELDSLEADE